MNEQGVDRGAVIAGVLFILIGAAFLFDRLGVWMLQSAYVLPLLLIGLGIAVFFGGQIRAERR